MMIELATGSLHDAQRHAEEMVSLSTEHGFSYFLAWGTVHRGTALTALGHAQEQGNRVKDFMRRRG